jgi:hypothetical protein
LDRKLTVMAEAANALTDIIDMTLLRLGGYRSAYCL